MSKIYLTVLFMLACFTFGFSQNDECANAIEIPPTQFTIAQFHSFEGMTIDQPAPSCKQNARQDAWFSFTAISTRMSITVETITSGQNIGLVVYTGSCSGTEVTCSEGNAWVNSNTLLYTIGQTYYLRVFTATDAAAINYKVSIRGFTPPTNDECVNAVSLTPSTEFAPTSGTFANATISTPAPSCNSSTPQDVWYTFVANAATMTIDVKNISSTNTAFQIFEGDCSGTSIYCGNPSSSNTGESHTYSNYVIGQTYTLRVYNHGTSTSNSTFNIGITSAAPPLNDEINNAITLTPGSQCNNISGTFAAATLNGTASTCATNASQDLWYKFTATQQMMRIVVGGNQGVDAAFELYKGTNNLVQCVNDANLNVSEIHTNNNFEVGQEYYVRVMNGSSTATTSGFTICVIEYSLPINADCATATTIIPNRVCTNTIGSMRGAIAHTSTAECSTISQEVWFKFVATEPTMSIVLGAREGLNHGMELYAGSCQSSAIQCANNGTMGQGESIEFEDLVVNETYFIRVYNVSTMYIGEFNICVIGSPIETCPAVVIISASETEICGGQNVHFTSTITNGGDMPSYRWMVNGVTVGNNAPVFTANNLQMNDIVTLAVVSNAECAPTNATRVSNSIQMTVNSSDAPTFAPIEAICVGESIVLPTTSMNGITGVWSPAFNANQTTQYTFTPDSYCSFNTQLTVEVLPQITLNVSRNGRILTATSNATSYQWINCATDQIVQENTSPVFTTTIDGSYKVVAITGNCSVESDCYDINSLAIEKLSTDIAVYPNPVVRFVTLSNVTEATMVKIINQLGKVVAQQIISSTHSLDLVDLPSGIYFLEVDQKHYKIVKQ